MHFKVCLNIVVTCLAFLTFSILAAAQTASPLSLSFDFRNGSQGWQGGFGDYSTSDESRLALRAEMRNLPPEPGVSGTGFYFQGTNHSDDLFMFMKRRLGPSDGIVAVQAYWLDNNPGLLCGSPLITQTDRMAQERSDYLVVKNWYSNYDYAYSVRIPKGLIGLRSPSPFPNHGFVIQLSDYPKASLIVDANYNAAEWSSFADAINAHKDIFKGEVGGEVRVVTQVPAVLGGLRAIHFTMKPRTSTSNDPELREVLLAFRRAAGEVGIVYEIVLTTPTSRYTKDKHLIAVIQKTWRLKSLPKGSSGQAGQDGTIFEPWPASALGLGVSICFMCADATRVLRTFQKIRY